MIDIAILRAMAAAGAPVEAILAAIEADQRAEIARVQARRLAGAERQRRHRHALSHGQPVTPRDTADKSASLTSSLSSSNTSGNSEKKKEKKVRAGTARKTALPGDWVPGEAHYAKASTFNLSAAHVAQKADDMRNWAKSKGVMRQDWDATFHGFLRPRESKTGMNGHGARPSAVATADRLIEAERLRAIGGDGPLLDLTPIRS